MSTPTVLIVEDEADLLKLIEFNMRQAGFATFAATTGSEAIEIARRERPDVILLDLMLPDVQGTDVCRTLRAQPETADVPILMVTARGEEIDRVVGFEIGADDYVVKPFSPRELVLRVKAVLKRTHRAPADASGAHDVLRFGELEVDISAHEVRVDGDLVDLTALEFRLITTLMQRAGRVQSRDQLLDDVWGDVSVTTRTVDTHVKRLREKLGDAARYVETVRGVGYRFSRQPS